MDKTLRLSLLYLLLIIPQHGNSPIPRMESWVEMDQGDGFVDRDMTSSLTGAESFGSAHKNYQNALIRKKEVNTEDDSVEEQQMDALSGDGRVEKKSPMQMSATANEYANYPYAQYMMNPDTNAMYGSPYGMSMMMPVYQDDRYQMKFSNKEVPEKATKVRMSDGYSNRRYSEGIPSPGLNSDLRMDRCSACVNRMYDMYKNYYRPDAGVDQSEYARGNDARMNNGMNDEYMKDIRFNQMYPNEGQDSNLNNFKREDEEEQGVDEYYAEEKNPCAYRSVCGAVDCDYNQICSHGVICKRDEKKQQSKSSDAGEETSGGSLGSSEKTKSLKESKPDNFLEATSPKEGREISKPEGRLAMQNNNDNVMWKMNDNLQSKELKEVMKDSQRALEEVQMFQQKLANKQQFNMPSYGWTSNNYYGNVKRKADNEKRDKREDEDEQKNMKTGSDEGGGEYEDEEGKGHNDEEEYYEEAGLISGKNREELQQVDGNMNPKFQKRAAGRESHSKSSKENEDKTDISSEDYELNLDNAPVENSDNSKKHSARGGNNSYNNGFSRA